MTLKDTLIYLTVGFIVGGFVALISGCVMISKDIHLTNSNNNEIPYTTHSETQADVKDLIDAAVDFKLK